MYEWVGKMERDKQVRKVVNYSIVEVGLWETFMVNLSLIFNPL